MILDKFSELYSRFEKYISPIGLIYGFIFTYLTLTRVDMFLENFWIVVHLIIASLGILILTLYENKAKAKNLPEAERLKFHFYLTLMIQFAFGGLFSTFFIFYLRSASLIQNWLFLILLAVLLIGNELWKKHYTRLAFQVIVLYISFYLFFIFLLPVIFHHISGGLFVAAGVISLIIILIFTLLLKKYSLEKFKSSHRALQMSIMGIFIVMNILYFTNIIPPIPLALKEAGAYHSVTKNSAGDYEVSSEPSLWSDYFNRYPVFYRRAGEPVYAFSAVFSPINFSTEIIHEWQYYDEIKKTWVDSSKIVLLTTGGRDGGFRTYSVKSSLTPGLWRVKVMINSGQILGYINFRIVFTNTSLDLIKKVL